MVIKKPCSKFEHGFSFLSAASAGTNSYAVGFFKSWRKEFAGREFDMLENLAGVVGSGNTFLTRNTEVIGGNKHLHLTFQLNYGEKSEGNKNFSCAGIYKVAVEKIGNGFREAYISGIAFTVAVIRKAAVKNNRRYNLNNRSRAVGSKSRAGKRIFGTENFYVSFASVKDNLFGKEGNADNGIRCGNRGVICGKVYKDVKGHINRIKTPVEMDGF